MTSGEILATAGLRPMIAVPSVRGRPTDTIIVDHGTLSAPGVRVRFARQRAAAPNSREERVMTHRA
jgi:hypothetical protein